MRSRRSTCRIGSLAAAGCLAIVAGCIDDPPALPPAKANAASARSAEKTTSAPSVAVAPPEQRVPDPALRPREGDFPTLTLRDPAEIAAMEEERAETPILADVLGADAFDATGRLRQEFPPPPEIDEERARAAGLRILDGKHLRLVTDLPSSPEIDGLPALFDEATPLWADYLGVPPEKLADWKVQGYLLDREEPFRALGLIREELPDIRHGYQLGREFWCRRQEELGYYQRHLFLHEGVHAFMTNFLGGTGPPWYAEGMAEVLATHRVENQTLVLPVMPRDRDEVPLWGRTKVIRDAFAANEGKRMAEILAYGPRAHRETEAYAWSWALCWFLTHHPLSRDAFLDQANHVQDYVGDFNDGLRERLAGAWPRLEQDWALLVAEMDYGYDVAANVPVRRDASPLGQPIQVSVANDTGWQSTGALVEAGKTYRVRPSGFASVRIDDEVWTYDAAGATLWYFSRRPYGELQFTVVDESAGADNASPAFLVPRSVLPEGLVTPQSGGTLYLRTNLPSSLRAGAEGQIVAEISPEP